MKSKQGRPITFMAHIGAICHKTLYYSMVSREFEISCLEKLREISRKCREKLWNPKLRPSIFLQNSRWRDLSQEITFESPYQKNQIKSIVKDVSNTFVFPLLFGSQELCWATKRSDSIVSHVCHDEGRKLSKSQDLKNILLTKVFFNFFLKTTE